MSNKSTADLVGRTITFTKAISGDDVTQFATLSGDDHPIHTDEAFATNAGLPGRIVQGSLLVGLMAGASTKFFRDNDLPALSYGYDKLRFTGQVALGATLTVSYAIVEHDLAARKTIAQVEVKDDGGRLVAVARHIAKII